MLLRRLAVLVFCGLPCVAVAEANHGADSHWDGLGHLLEIAGESGAVEVPERVVVATLTSDDSLLIVHPTTDLPVADITAFLRRGGRVAIADDQGSGDELLTAFGIAREPYVSVDSTLRVRDNPALLIARPAGVHPLTHQIRAVVTNHPTSLSHAELEPVFTLGEEQSLMLAGAVGQGRLIAIGDSSLFINNMMVLDGNRQLARNLIRYLREGRSGRLMMVVGSTPMNRRLADHLAAPVDGMRSLLTRIANVTLPAPLIAFSAWVLCLFGFALAASGTQLKSPYTRMTLFTRAPTVAGFAGRVGFFRGHARNLVQPTLAFKIELEAALLHRLGIESTLLLGEVVDVLARRHASPDLIARTRGLLSELDEIAAQEERGVEPPLVRPEKFHEVVSRGERILADIARLE